MKKLLLFCSLAICLVAVSMNPARIPIVKAADAMPQLSENVMVMVNCTTASMATISTVTSTNVSLVHFPSGVDMNDVDLTNVTTISAMFSATESSLIFAFSSTDATTARSIADGFISSMSSAFSTSFAWFSTGTSDDTVNVTYTGPGKPSLSVYVDGLMSDCLASGLEGFSLTFSPMSHEAGAYASVTAHKDIGGFDWAYYMMTGYVTTMTGGSDSHLVDILDLLDVDSLAPSPYAAEVEVGYASQIMLTVSSDSPVTYVSSQPANVSDPTERGWFMYPLPPTNSLMALFYFGSDSSSQSPLTLTFSGVVVPEFTTVTLLMLFLVSAIVAVAARKRFPR